MDFALTHEQRALADSVRRFCERQYDPASRRVLIENGAHFSAQNWRAFVDLGWIGAGVSEADGGFGGSAIETAIILQEFGRALVLEPFVGFAALALQTLVALPVGETRDLLIAAILAGEAYIALAHGEPVSRGEIESCSSAAEQTAEGWTVSGHKSLVLGGAIASAYLVSACNSEGIALFLVQAGAAGVVAKPYRAIDNHLVADLHFEAAPATLVAQSSVAGAAIAAGHAHALVCICAEAIGSMDVLMEITGEHVRTRRQFGTTLSSFQAVQHRMADMLVELELARSTLYYGLANVAVAGPERGHALATMKAVVSTAALFVGRNAIQLHGAIGVTDECIVSHHYRRLTVIAALFGNESLHLQKLSELRKPIWRAGPMEELL